jgi:hypothetical protein
LPTNSSDDSSLPIRRKKLKPQPNVDQIAIERMTVMELTVGTMGNATRNCLSNAVHIAVIGIDQCAKISTHTFVSSSLET